MKRETFYAENITNDVAELVTLQKGRDRWRAWGIAGWTFAAIGCVSTATMGLLHTFVPVVVNVDPRSGAANVHVGPVRYDVTNEKNDLMLTADAIRYVTAREGFTQAEADRNYRTVWVMSPPALRDAWDAEYKAETNPQALVATMKTTDRIEVENPIITFVPTNLPNVRLIQVRYDKVRNIAGKPPSTQRMMSTMTVQYDPKAVSNKIENIVLNFSGFQVLNYRTTKETDEVAIAPVRAVPAGVFPTDASSAGR